MATLEHVRLAEVIHMKLVDGQHNITAPTTDTSKDEDYDDAFGDGFDEGLDAAFDHASAAVDDAANAALETMAVYLTLSGQLEAAKLLRSWRS